VFPAPRHLPLGLTNEGRQVTEHHIDRPGSGYLMVMSLGALGVVYGDIGTSPLYALREAFIAAEGLAVTRETVLGVISLMVWSLIIVVSIKYMAFVLRADNDGEGGILALTSLILPSAQSRGSRVRWGLVLLGLFGTALLYGDGMITPAISVLSAVEGLEIAAPSLESYVVPIAAVILVALFSIQRRGTATVGAMFGPIMIVWFGTLAVLGVNQITVEPGVLSAVNPGYAVTLFVSHPRLAFLALGAVFLVVTGSEALFADMGHFGRRPIRLGWFTLVFPALILNYMGQGALLIRNPENIVNPFYRLPPEWAVLPLVLLATAATVIASQALISGAYSLTMQAVQLGYLPRVHIDHTSPRQIGQVYVASVNWALMAACVTLVVTFGSSSNLAAAYGVAVTTTMLLTTLLMTVVMRERWRWHPAVVWTVAGSFLCIDLAFFGANILKIPAGGWLPLVVGAAVFTVMTTWKRGREIVATRLRRGELPIERFVGSILASEQKRVRGTAVYLFPEPGVTPPALLVNLRSNEVIHDTVVLVSVYTTDTPQVPQGLRTEVHDLGEGFFQVVLRFGFMEDHNVTVALENIVHPDFGFDVTDATFFVGKETIIPTDVPGMAIWRERLYALLHRNASSAARFFGLPRAQVMEVGVQLEI